MEGRRKYIYRLFLLIVDSSRRLRLSVFFSSLLNFVNIIAQLAAFLKYGAILALASAIYFLLVFSLRLRILLRGGGRAALEGKSLILSALYLFIADLLWAFVLFSSLKAERPIFTLANFLYYAYAAYCFVSSLSEIIRSLKIGGVTALAARSLSLNSALFALFNILNAVLPLILSQRAAGITVFCLGVITVAFLLSVCFYLFSLGKIHSSVEKSYNDTSGVTPQ